MKIRSVSSAVNPTPRPSTAQRRQIYTNELDSDFQVVAEGVIGVDYLVKVTGCEDLTLVPEVSLIVNTSTQSLLDLCDHLPNLISLVLDHSTIASIRDLGVGLRMLEKLSLRDCQLSELDGIGVLSCLKYLDVSDNMISDASPLAMHEYLEVINYCDILLSCLYVLRYYVVFAGS